MKGFHPNVRHLAALALCAIALGGCRSGGGGGGPSAFFAPDRVPPPATRALAPGQAQPYYPGDPLPVMQSATTPPADAVAKTEGRIQEVSPNGRVLAWNAPGGATPAEPPAPEPRALAASNEGAVAIPTDGDSLRFALPQPVAPQPIAQQPTAPQPPVAAPQQPNQFAAAPPTQSGVIPASYYEPETGSKFAPNDPSVIAAPARGGMPWQIPQVAAPNTATPVFSNPPVAAVAVASPLALPAPPAAPLNQAASGPSGNTMAVSMRAVPSPPPQPGAPMPRIRMPSYAEPIQTIEVADGFRPRSSMR